MKTHTLKIRRCYLDSILSWDKTAEVRNNDRDFQKTDQIIFVPLDNDDETPIYSQQEGTWEITHVLHYPEGMYDWYVVLSIKRLTNETSIPQ